MDKTLEEILHNRMIEIEADKHALFEREVYARFVEHSGKLNLSNRFKRGIARFPYLYKIAIRIKRMISK
jgi:hypothetical protein